MKARDTLFDLAVNRAATFQRSAGPHTRLEEWQARTRFSSRVDLEAVRGALATRPGDGEWHWEGGREGRWVPGKAAAP